MERGRVPLVISWSSRASPLYAIACSVQRGNALIALGGYANAVRVFGPTS